MLPSSDAAAVALRVVLTVLAVYHLGIGVVSIASLRMTAFVTGRLYGLTVSGSSALRYAVRMLGLYAVALGTLLALAARAPGSHRDVIVVVALLQLARALHRVVLRRELYDGFQVPPRRNAFNAALLVAEAMILLVCMPMVPT